MVTKRITPQEEIDRINERIASQSGVRVTDRSLYDFAFGRVWDTPERELTDRQKAFRNRSFKQFRSENKGVSDLRTKKQKDDQRLFRSRGGKNLFQDRKTDAKIIVDRKEDFTDAARQDLRGLDTKKFNVMAKRKQQQVFARKTTVKRRGKTVNILRDKRGRFVKRS